MMDATQAGFRGTQFYLRVAPSRERHDARFPNIDSAALAHLFDAVEEIRAWRGGRWTSHVPHLYALTAEACPVALTGRRDELFLMTGISSLHSDGVSAVQRLLRGV